MIAQGTSLAQAYDQSHSRLFDLSDEAPSAAALVEYRQDPVGFFVDVLGVPRHRIEWSLNPGFEDHEWDGDRDPLVAMLNAVRDWKDVCVEAATGTQKSYTAGGLVLWFIACWEGALAFTFAPSEDQLKGYMWKEIRALWPAFQARFPTATLLGLEIRMRGGQDNTWGARGVSVRRRAGEEVSVAAQGMHGPHMLIIYEETPGIEYPVIEAGENTCTAPHNIRVAVGNTDNQFDTLHRFGYEPTGAPRPDVTCLRISALDHPNVVCNDPDIVPGAASKKSIERRALKYGVDHRLYRSRIRGISPSEATEALIKLEWVHAAQQRWADENDRRVLTADGKAPRALGVDVANSEGGDEGSISEWVGACCESVISFPCPNANNLGFDVHLKMRDKHIEDEHVGVDSVGVGAGCVNELRKRERWIRALGGADSPIARPGEDEEYDNLRSQILYTLREDLRLGNIALPPSQSLAQDLITPTWTTKNGKIVVESKETLKKRLPGGRSPNEGDAVAYGNWVRDRTIIMSQIPKKHPTQLQRIRKEMERLDREEQAAAATGKYGSVIRQ